MKLNFAPNINFKSIIDEYRYENYQNSEHKMIYCTTRLFRDDLEWGDFVDFLSDFYKNQQKVNTIDLSCSDGSEVYSMAMLMNKNPENKKFYPIKAYDLNSELIFQANKGRVFLGMDDIIACKKLGIDFDDNFEKIQSLLGEFKLYRVSPKIRDNIEFQPCEATRVLGNMKSKTDNTVLLFRNTLPYLTKENREKCYSLIDEKLGENSIVVLGGHDKYVLGSEAEDELSKCGFKKHPDLKWVYVRS